MDSSVTTWIGLLKTGQEDAAQRLWERFFPQLLRLASARLRGLPTREADEEDVALSAFHSFYRAVAADRLPQLNNRDDLWRALVLITVGKAVDLRRYRQAQKGGGPGARAGGDLALLEEVIGREPDPAFAALVAEECQTLLARLDDDELREIGVLRLEGYTIEEIAQRLRCSVRTVKRRVALIRRAWEAAAGENGP